MGQDSKIEWCNHSWNPWVGCLKVSAGCKNCYMYREQTRHGNDPTFVRRTKTLNDPLNWNKKATDNKNNLVFTCSYSDFFIDCADSWRDEAWDIIRRTPNLIYQILTKRIVRVQECLPSDWPLPNVWLGVSAENQAMADERIPLLLQTPAAVRFVSAEPLLSRLDLRGIHASGFFPDETDASPIQLDWCIVGSESGPGARPMELDWARSLRDQCQAAGVPFFLKQSFENGKLVKMPEMDGKVWNEMPQFSSYVDSNDNRILRDTE